MALRLLIVDDSPAMRAFVRRVLDLSGLIIGKCVEAANGSEALDVLHEEWMDVVLTDINMPVMNGEQLVRSLAAEDRLQSIPVIVLSTDASAGRARQMLALGAKGYLTKPFHPETLREAIENVLGVQHAG